MLIVNIPIEPLEARYSKQWNDWFKHQFSNRNIRQVTIEPSPLTLEIKDGGFLDVIGTNYYKANQISNICFVVNRGGIPRDSRVVFLIQDGWFPVEQLAYMRDMLGCHDWKFVGIFHDGTYDKWDLTARNRMYTWGEALENAWFKIYDAVVVGSHYHKDVLMETRKVLASKIHVIPWHVEVPLFPGHWGVDVKKENIVVFPHRLDAEKQPDLFMKLAKDCQYSAYKFIRTQDEVRSKDQYYQLIARSKIAVSMSLLEMFGIAMAEATLLGCIPLVPDRLSYREMYRPKYRYHDYDDLLEKIGELMYDLNVNTATRQATPISNIFHHEFYPRENFFDRIFGLLETV